jgi:hypothetical protein
MTYTVDQIADAVEGACFYVTPQGLWLRVLYVELDEGYFQALDEDSGEEYNFYFEEMVADGEDPEFHHLERTEIG